MVFLAIIIGMYCLALIIVPNEVVDFMFVFGPIVPILYSCIYCYKKHDIHLLIVSIVTCLYAFFVLAFIILGVKFCKAYRTTVSNFIHYILENYSPQEKEDFNESIITFFKECSEGKSTITAWENLKANADKFSIEVNKKADLQKKNIEEIPCKGE
jgi:hypothetical protein